MMLHALSHCPPVSLSLSPSHTHTCTQSLSLEMQAVCSIIGTALPPHKQQFSDSEKHCLHTETPWMGHLSPVPGGPGILRPQPHVAAEVGELTNTGEPRDAEPWQWGRVSSKASRHSGLQRLPGGCVRRAE